MLNDPAPAPQEAYGHVPISSDRHTAGFKIQASGQHQATQCHLQAVVALPLPPAQPQLREQHMRQ